MATWRANNGGWQWAASTGTDAAPYFRIFNPTTRGEKFDKQGGVYTSLAAGAGKGAGEGPASAVGVGG